METLYTTGEMIDTLFKKPSLKFVDTTKLFYAYINNAGVLIIADKFNNIMPHLSLMDKSNSWTIYQKPKEDSMNYETDLVYKWYINQIDCVLEDNPNMDDEALSCLLAERIEADILEQLSECNEGFVSEVIGDSIKNIDFIELIKRYKKYN